MPHASPRILSLSLSLSLSCAVAVGACSGSVGEERPRDPRGGPPGAPAPGASDPPPGGGAGTGRPPGSPPAPLPAGARDPGRVTLHRLNRVEYDLTVRDLLGTALRPGAAFLNDAPDTGFDNNADLLTLSPVQVELYRQASTALVEDLWADARRRATVVTCDPAEGERCLRPLLTGFGARAFRRPLAAAEVTAYLGLVGKATAAGATPDEGVKVAVRAMLMSPHFLFRIELDPDPRDPTPHPVGPYEMASRLSYLVYGSMPDAPLFAAAESGKLARPEGIEAELVRMLADPKGKAFAARFAGQWLGLGLLDAAQPDPKLFKWSTGMAQSMRTEVELFFAELLEKNRPPAELLTARFTHVDERLAKHYKLPAVTAWTRASLETSERGGLLGMGGILTATSYPTRTSAVKRGAWVLSQLLCAEPPPPPPDVDALPTGPTAGATQRALLAEHRKNPSCAGCHTLIDPIGLALESYDPIGAWRATDGGAAIDARGALPGGAAFDGPRELSAALAADPRLGHCLAEKLLSFAVGRATRGADEPYLAELAEGLKKPGAGLRDLLVAAVKSEPFRHRRAERPEDQEVKR